MSKRNARNTQIVESVYDFTGRKTLTIDQFALMMGVKGTELKQYLRGYFLGDRRAFENKIVSVIDRENAKKKLPSANISFVETTLSRRIWESCRLCQLQTDIGVLFGEAGIGKTFACREYVARHPDALFVECLNGFSATYLFSKLCSLLDLSETMGLRYSFEAVVKQLKGSGRLIIVDEAEHIQYRGLDLIRRIYDFTGCGIVLVGLPALLGNLRGKKGEFRQLFSRVGIAVRLDSITETDAENLVKCWLPDSAEQWPNFWKVAKSNARRLSKLCKMSRHIADVNNCVIDKDVIFKAAEVLIS